MTGQSFRTTKASNDKAKRERESELGFLSVNPCSDSLRGFQPSRSRTDQRVGKLPLRGANATPVEAVTFSAEKRSRGGITDRVNPILSKEFTPDSLESSNSPRYKNMSAMARYDTMQHLRYDETESVRPALSLQPIS